VFASHTAFAARVTGNPNRRCWKGKLQDIDNAENGGRALTNLALSAGAFSRAACIE
jgi:hypothetical protein